MYRYTKESQKHWLKDINLILREIEKDILLGKYPNNKLPKSWEIQQKYNIRSPHSLKRIMDLLKEKNIIECKLWDGCYIKTRNFEFTPIKIGYQFVPPLKKILKIINMDQKYFCEKYKIIFEERNKNETI